jgi:hypothetical protein
MAYYLAFDALLGCKGDFELTFLRSVRGPLLAARPLSSRGGETYVILHPVMELDVVRLELSDVLGRKSLQGVMTEVDVHSSQPNDKFPVHLIFRVAMLFFQM